MILIDLNLQLKTRINQIESMIRSTLYNHSSVYYPYKAKAT